MGAAEHVELDDGVSADAASDHACIAESWGTGSCCCLITCCSSGSSRVNLTRRSTSEDSLGENSRIAFCLCVQIVSSRCPPLLLLPPFLSSFILAALATLPAMQMEDTPAAAAVSFSVASVAMAEFASFVAAQASYAPQPPVRCHGNFPVRTNACFWSALPSQPQVPPPMIRILGRDTGAQFALCEMLDLKTIGRLHRSCRTWRRWINESALGSNRLLQFGWRVPASFRSCDWVRRYAQRLVIGLWRPCAPSEDREQSDRESEAGRLDQIALRLLPHLNRLRSLQIVLDHPSTAMPDRLPLASATLTTLMLDIRSHSRDVDTVTPAFLRSVGGLPSLTSLQISSEHLSDRFAGLDFSALPSLLHLQRLSIQSKGAMRCNQTQVNALVACRALTDFDVGEWSPDLDDADIADQQLSSYGRGQLTYGIVAVIEGRKRNGAAPFRRLALGSPGLVTPSVAEHFLAGLVGVHRNCVLELHADRGSLGSASPFDVLAHPSHRRHRTRSSGRALRRACSLAAGGAADRAAAMPGAHIADAVLSATAFHTRAPQDPCHAALRASTSAVLDFARDADRISRAVDPRSEAHSPHTGSLLRFGLQACVHALAGASASHAHLAAARARPG